MWGMSSISGLNAFCSAFGMRKGKGIGAGTILRKGMEIVYKGKKTISNIETVGQTIEKLVNK